jgi:predicted thioesterase
MDLKDVLSLGTVKRLVKKVSTSDTVGNKSEALEEFLSTTACLEAMTQLAVELLDPKLPEGVISVGIMSHVENLAPAVLGDDVVFTVSLDNVEGNRVFFSMTASDVYGPVAKGTQERAVVHVSALERKVAERQGR